MQFEVDEQKRRVCGVGDLDAARGKVYDVEDLRLGRLDRRQLGTDLHLSSSLASSEIFSRRFASSFEKGMNEPANEGRLGRCAADHAPASAGGNIGSKECVDTPSLRIDNKENLYTVSANRYDLAPLPRATTQSKTAKKGERSNLRKSLAWNQAFFTDEGVLDPSELSTLCGSSAKSSTSLMKESFLVDLNGDLSPLKSYEVSTRGNSHAELDMGSALRHKKLNDSLSSLYQPKREGARTNEVPEKTLVVKSASRSIPRVPSNYSLKRAADISGNAASKLPKFTANMSHLSSISSSRCSVPTKLPNQNLKPAKADESTKSRISSLTLKKDTICPTMPSKKNTVNEDSCLPPQQPEKLISTLRKPQNQEPSRSFSATSGSSSFETTEYEIPRNFGSNPSRHNPAEAQPRASGLKMPTPSIGFFRAAKSRPLVPKASQGSQVFALKSQLPRPTILQKATLPSLGTRERCGHESSIRKENPTLVSDIMAKKHSLEDVKEDLHSVMDERNVERESVQDGQTRGLELSNSVEPSSDNRPLVLERESMIILEKSNTLGPLFESSQEKTQPSEYALGDSVTHQQETGTVPDVCTPDYHELVGVSSSLEVETSSRSIKTQVMDASASLTLPTSTSEKVFPPAETETTESHVPSVEQCQNTIQLASRCTVAEDSSRKADPMDNTKDASMLLNQLKAAPFSDEWIAALETFGEDILQVKSGAVQNSPKEKPNPEPGPWSPVKRKNLDVGPYDCTKYSKNPSSTNTSP